MQLLPKWSVKPFAKPYVAGIKTDEVLNVVKSLNNDGFSATIDILGEFVSNKDEAIQVKNEYSDFSSSPIRTFSTRLSEAVTKSPGLFSDTCNFSISPKSLIKILDAFIQAFCIRLN